MLRNLYIKILKMSNKQKSENSKKNISNYKKEINNIEKEWGGPYIL